MSRLRIPQLLCFLLVSLAPTQPLIASQDIVVRTHITPESVWVGQRMTLQIDVLGKAGWAQITDLDSLEIPNCYRLPAGNSRVRLQEKIEGADYSGQRYELSLYPQRDGTIQIPEIPLPIRLQTWGTQGGSTTASARTEAFSIEAKLPAGVKNVQSFVASSQFSATQTWSSKADSFIVGNALTRSIRLEATDLPAMLLPLIGSPDIPLLSSYPETPELNDTTNRGTPTGQRDETITYVFETNGTAELPTYTFKWWNTTNETLQTITLPGRTVQLSGGTVSTPPAAAERQSSNFSKYAVGSLTIFAATLSLLVLLRRRTKQYDIRSTEKHLFNQLNAAQHSSATCLQHTLTWIRTLTSGRLTLSQFLQNFSDPHTQTIATTLLRDPTQATDLPALIAGLRTARSRYLKAQAKSRRIDAADRTLPPLNG